MAPRTKAKADAPADDWNSREPEADDHSGQDDQDTEGEGDGPDQDDGEDTSAEDFAAMSSVDHDAPAAEGIALGGAQLTDRQRAGLDPVDVQKHIDQAGDRAGLANMQTEHELANALDPVSGTPNPGVTGDPGHNAPGKAGANDMSGKPALPDPLAGLDDQARGVMKALSKASKDAHQRDRAAGHGWVSLRDLKVHKAVMDKLVQVGAVHQDTRPGGQFSPETGTVYRTADHDKAA